MFKITGLDPLIYGGSRVRFKEDQPGIELHVLFDWIASVGWELFNSTAMALPNPTTPFATFVFKREGIIPVTGIQ